MNDAIKNLIMCFDDENGLPEAVYDATYEVIEQTLGEPAASTFSNYMDASDGMFYIRRDSLWSMLNEIFV